MKACDLGQMVRVLNASPSGMHSWEAEMVQRAHQESCNGFRPQRLSLRQVELILTIFNRIYHA